MRTTSFKARTAGLVLAGAVGTAVLSAGVANAEPAGCSSGVSGSTSASGLLTAHGYGPCKVAVTRTLRVEIKQAIGGQPDPLLAGNNQYASTTLYSVYVSSCDGGQTNYYYGRAFFTSNATYHDSPSTRQTTC